MKKTADLTFRASYGTIIFYGALGILFLANSILHYRTGNWFVVPEAILAWVNFLVVARLLTSPVLEIRDDNIQFLRNAVTPTKIVSIKEIIDIEKLKKYSFTIVLKNRKTVTLPIRWIKKSELEIFRSAWRKIEDTVQANTGV